MHKLLIALQIVVCISSGLPSRDAAVVAYGCSPWGARLGHVVRASGPKPFRSASARSPRSLPQPEVMHPTTEIFAGIGVEDNSTPEGMWARAMPSARNFTHLAFASARSVHLAAIIIRAGDARPSNFDSQDGVGSYFRVRVEADSTCGRSSRRKGCIHRGCEKTTWQDCHTQEENKRVGG
jgi:hypothetical protein